MAVGLIKRGSVVKRTFIREKSLTRRNCVYQSVSLFKYSEEEQAAVRRTRQKRERATLPKVKAMNDRYSRELFEWLVHNNFAKGDYFVILTYSQKVSQQDGKRLFVNFIRRLRRLYLSKGADLRYMCVEEYGEKGGLYHIHALIGSANGAVSKNDIIALWKKNGNCHVEGIKNSSEDLCAICNYLVKSQKTKSKFKRLWSCSRTCKRPEIVTDDGRITKKAMRKLQSAARNGELAAEIEKIYKGWRVISAESCVNEVTGRHYLRFRLLCKQARTLPRTTRAQHISFAPKSAQYGLFAALGI